MADALKKLKQGTSCCNCITSAPCQAACRRAARHSASGGVHSRVGELPTGQQLNTGKAEKAARKGSFLERTPLGLNFTGLVFDRSGRSQEGAAPPRRLPGVGRCSRRAGASASSPGARRPRWGRAVRMRAATPARPAEPRTRCKPGPGLCLRGGLRRPRPAGAARPLCPASNRAGPASAGIGVVPSPPRPPQARPARQGHELLWLRAERGCGHPAERRG